MKVIIALAFVVSFTVAFEACGKKASSSQIVGGLPAGHGEFPWQISLRYSESPDSIPWEHVCGGKVSRGARETGST